MSPFQAAGSDFTKIPGNLDTKVRIQNTYINVLRMKAAQKSNNSKLPLYKGIVLRFYSLL